MNRNVLLLIGVVAVLAVVAAIFIGRGGEEKPGVPGVSMVRDDLEPVDAAKVEQEVQAAIDKIEQELMLGQVDYENLNINEGERSYSLVNLVFTPNPGSSSDLETLVIDELKIYNVKNKPNNGHYVMSGMHLPSSSFDQEAIRNLTAMGYDPNNIKTDFELNYSYNPEGGRLDLHNVSMGAPDMIRVNLRLGLSNVNITGTNPMALLFTAPFIQIHNGELVVVDDSVIQRAIDLEMSRTGKSKDEVLDQAYTEIDGTIAQIKQSGSPGSEYAIQALQAIKTFVKTQGSITVNISPDQPVTVQALQELQDPIRALDMLNLKVTAN